jgi:hypothetical protein
MYSNRYIFCADLCCPVCHDLTQICQCFTSHNVITVVIGMIVPNAHCDFSVIYRSSSEQTLLFWIRILVSPECWCN